MIKIENMKDILGLDWEGKPTSAFRYYGVETLEIKADPAEWEFTGEFREAKEGENSPYIDGSGVCKWQVRSGPPRLILRRKKKLVKDVTFKFLGHRLAKKGEYIRVAGNSYDNFTRAEFDYKEETYDVYEKIETERYE